MSTLPPYDKVIDVLNVAKVRLNDRVETLAAIGGQLLDNTQPFSQTALNAAWRKLQEVLADLGYTGSKQELSFTSVPAATSTDPMVQCYFDFNGYNNSGTYNTSFALPQGLIRPLKLWERITSSTALMTEMDNPLNGLPKVPKLLWNRQWEWRSDQLWVPGSTSIMDINIRYVQLIVDFADVGVTPGPNQIASTPWFGQPVPIMRCLDALADYLCREIAIAVKNQEAAMAFESSAKANAQLIVNRDTQQGKSIGKVSELGRMRDPFTPEQGGPSTQPTRRP